jgi:hypothetical protein
MERRVGKWQYLRQQQLHQQAADSAEVVVAAEAVDAGGDRHSTQGSGFGRASAALCRRI